MCNSELRVLTIVAPIRRPVNEPGPDMKVISEISCQEAWFSCNLSWINVKIFSARALPRGEVYSWSSSLRIVFGVEVSRYSFI